MAKVRGAIVVDKETCKGCGLCIEACPYDVLSFHTEVNSKGYHYAYMEKVDACIGCANCGAVCPDTCIEVYRAKI